MIKLFLVAFLLAPLAIFAQSDGSPEYIISLIDQLRALLASGETVTTVDLFNTYVFIITGFLAMISSYLIRYWKKWRDWNMDGYIKHMAVVLVFILLLAIGRFGMDFNSILQILGGSGIFSLIYALIKQWATPKNPTP